MHRECDEQAFETIEHSTAQLQQMVAERTLELFKANQELRQEIERRKKTEIRLKEGEKKYYNLFQFANDAILIIEGDKFVDCNVMAEKIFGCSSGDIIGKTLYEPFSPEFQPNGTSSREAALEIIRATLAGNMQRFEWKHRRYDGTLFDAEVSLSIVSIDDKALLQAIVRDVTENKLTEAALALSEEKYRTIIENMHDVIYVYGADFSMTYVSPNVGQYGYSPEDVVNFHILQYVHPDDQAMVIETATRTVSLGESAPIVFRVVTKAGDIRIVEDKARAVRGANGNIACVIGVLRDITERKDAEDALVAAVQQLNDIIDFLPDATFVIDTDKRVISWNRAMEEMTGLRKEEIIGQGDHKYTIPFYGQRRRQLLDLIDMNDEELEAKYIFVKRIGRTLYAEAFAPALYSGKGAFIFMTGTPLFDAKGNRVGAIESIRDITERKSLEKQFFESQKIEAIGALAGGIAHDFNNILGAIIGYTELAMGENQQEFREQHLREALKGAERAKNLVKQILTFSRQDNHEKKPVEIKFLLKEAIKFLRASIPTTIEITQKITNESCTIMADPTHMHQIIMNLCTNAAHAMKQAGGILKIELSIIELAKEEFPRHPGMKSGPYIKLIISDTGHGIDAAHIQRIFDPFFTTKSQEEGTGLGLSVVYGIVKAHGGMIDVYSEPGNGAQFDVYLPRVNGKETANVIISETAVGGIERILFVDDEQALVDLGTRILSSLGYEVTGVTSSLEAMDLFRAEPMRFDLVITDMTLPKMTGIALSRIILKIRPGIPIILCSGTREHETEEKAKSLGIRAYLTKPLTRIEISKVIRDTLDGRNNPLS